MKTILIVPKGPSCPVRVVEFPSSPVVKREIEDEEMECPRRKKVKLDHLSSEEKMMRRKMKNRAAAQSARDRKKARMEELECLVKILEEQHSKLAAENKILRLQNEALEEENAELRRSLGMDGTTPIGPAESISAPLPREQGVKSQTVLNALFLQLLCLMQTKGSVSSSSLPPLSRMLNEEEEEMGVKLEEPILTTSCKPRWWGPHQQSWNPVIPKEEADD
jgi:hypothetical protein